MSNQETTSEKYPVVAIVNNQTITTSLNVAEVFGKRHDHVIRDINDLIKKVPEEFAAANFGANKIKVLNNPSGEEISHYKITRDGWVLLVFGFTGADAMQFKLAYLKAFNKMEEALRNQLRALPDPSAIANAKKEATGNALKLADRINEMDLGIKGLSKLCFYRQANLTQKECARLLGVTREQVQELERYLKGIGIVFAAISGNKRSKTALANIKGMLGLQADDHIADAGKEVEVANA